MALHHDAAIRTLRAELLRLEDARTELLRIIDDPRAHTSAICAQITQCDRETEELGRAIALLYGFVIPEQPMLDFDDGVEPFRGTLVSEKTPLARHLTVT